jgi:hypothetical protein
VKTLFHRFRSWLDVQLVLGNLSRDPLHIRGFPREHIEVRFEEVDERAFLFRIERHPDTERMTIVRDDHVLDVLGRLERASHSLGQLGDIPAIGSRLSVEPLQPDDCLNELKAFNVTLLYALICSPYCDDPLRAGNLLFQVHIVWHSHKLRVCRPPEDRMVRPREPYHFEGEGFGPEVPQIPERDG